MRRQEEASCHKPCGSMVADRADPRDYRHGHDKYSSGNCRDPSGTVGDDLASHMVVPLSLRDIGEALGVVAGAPQVSPLSDLGLSSCGPSSYRHRMTKRVPTDNNRQKVDGNFRRTLKRCFEGVQICLKLILGSCGRKDFHYMFHQRLTLGDLHWDIRTAQQQPQPCLAKKVSDTQSRLGSRAPARAAAPSQNRTEG